MVACRSAHSGGAVPSTGSCFDLACRGVQDQGLGGRGDVGTSVRMGGVVGTVCGGPGFPELNDPRRQSRWHRLPGAIHTMTSIRGRKAFTMIELIIAAVMGR